MFGNRRRHANDDGPGARGGRKAKKSCLRSPAAGPTGARAVVGSWNHVCVGCVRVTSLANNAAARCRMVKDERRRAPTTWETLAVAGGRNGVCCMSLYELTMLMLIVSAVPKRVSASPTTTKPQPA